MLNKNDFVYKPLCNKSGPNEKSMKSGYPKLHRLETPWESDCLIVVFLMTLFCFVLGNFEMSIT